MHAYRSIFIHALSRGCSQDPEPLALKAKGIGTQSMSM